MKDTIHYHKCPMCGSTETAPFTVATDHLVSGQQFTIVRCKSCGFLFTQDAPSASSIGPYYESKNYQPHTRQKGLMPLLYRSARSVMLRWKYRMIRRHHAVHGTLIDVGAGSGHFMAYMRHRRWRVMGCEQSGQARAEAWEQCQLRLDGDVMHCNYPPACADVITAWHAIEHIHDMHGLWRHFGQWLKSDGLLVVAMPNCGSHDARHYGSRWAAWDVPRHLWHFDARTINMLGRQHGFELICVKPLPLDACYIALLSECNTLKGIINGLRFSTLGALHPRRASALIYVFKKAYSDEHV